MLIESKSRLGMLKNWFIASSFKTMDIGRYRSWLPDQWYIARKKHILDYVSWERSNWLCHVWLFAGFMDTLSAFDPASASLLVSYSWLMLGQAYLLLAIMNISINGMKRRYNAVVYNRVRDILPFDIRSQYNERACAYDYANGKKFDEILHSKIKEYTTGSVFFYRSQKDSIASFIDFVDIADSLIVPWATNEEKPSDDSLDNHCAV